MSLRDRVSSVVAFLRAGYPIGVCAVGYVPLLALLPRRVSDDEIAVVTRSLMPGRQPAGSVDIGVAITRITHEMPLPDDIERVQRRLASFGA